MVPNVVHQRNPSAPTQPIPIKHAGRICGLYDASTRVHNRRWLAGHRVRRFDAIAYNLEVINELEALGCEILENYNPEMGATYRMTLPEFQSRAIPFDFGHGPQLCVPVSDWRKIDGPEWPDIDDGVQAAPAWLQAGLFEVPQA